MLKISLKSFKKVVITRSSHRNEEKQADPRIEGFNELLMIIKSSGWPILIGNFIRVECPKSECPIRSTP
jgi:hypothetical protein